MDTPRCIQVRIDVDDKIRPALVDYLLGLSPSGVLEGTEWGDGVLPVTVYFTPDEAPAALEAIRAYLASLGNMWGRAAVRDLAVEEIGDGWRTEYQRYFKAKKVTDRLIVAPPWEKYDPGEDEIVVEIVPGQAFGTGTHETTILCLRAMEALFRTRRIESFLDVGSGSGILAIAAALLGEGSVKAVESDPDAVRAARENLAANRVSDRVHMVHAAYPEGVAAGETFDVITANLTGTDIRTHAESLSGATAAGGYLIVSGFLVEEADSITEALSTEGMEMTELLTLGEWGAAVFNWQGRLP
ncbi:MAG: 50S ribosomal protein L11 methyltransferase [Deltaproteobacteria bacterium]|nr:50S ribosomal protein L11 methyltransferase [Candidatus Zymogenaceae bacterium]